MLISFSAKNFESIRDRIEWDAEALRAYKERENSLITSDHPRAKDSYLPVSAFYGANGAGKSAILDALAYLRHLVLRSDQYEARGADLPYSPFLLDDTSRELPTEFAIEVECEGIRYDYSFALEAMRIVWEKLVAYPQSRGQVWFSRNGSDIKGSEYLRLNAIYKSLISDKTLILTWLGKNPNVKVKNDPRPLFQWFAHDMRLINQSPGFSVDLNELEDVIEGKYGTAQQKWVLRLVAAADLGIRGARVVNEPIRAERRAKEQKLLKLFREEGVLPDGLDLEDPSEILLNDRHVELAHTGASGKSYDLHDRFESMGTKRFMMLAAPLVDVLDRGGVLVVDELDSSLHPILVREVLSLFLDPEVNVNGAQLLFTAHDSSLLDSGLLRRDAIWFVEKDAEGVTSLTPLSDYSVRKGTRLGDWYLGGRFDAIPSIEEAFDMPALHGDPAPYADERG